MPRFPETPDGRYFVASHVLWRKSDPRLSEDERARHVKALMTARRAVRDAADEDHTKAARAAVRSAKEALGERGPVWWSDGAEDLTGRAPRNTVYADWWEGLSDEAKAPARSRRKGKDKAQGGSREADDA